MASIKNQSAPGNSSEKDGATRVGPGCTVLDERSTHGWVPGIQREPLEDAPSKGESQKETG